MSDLRAVLDDLEIILAEAYRARDAYNAMCSARPFWDRGRKADDAALELKDSLRDVRWRISGMIETLVEVTNCRHPNTHETLDSYVCEDCGWEDVERER